MNEALWARLHAAINKKDTPHEQVNMILLSLTAGGLEGLSYEESKKALRAATGMDEMILVCEMCLEVWEDGTQVAKLEDHVQEHHPGEQVRLMLVWIGNGPPPKATARKR